MTLVASTGLITIEKRAVTTVGSSLVAPLLNVWSLVGYSRSGTTGTIYLNGVALNTLTDAQDYSSAGTSFGANHPITSSPFLGTLGRPLAYNRALTAAEVLALYQTGAPAAADYHAGLVGTVISAGSFVVGRRYRILVVGTTSFTGIGASANTIGVEFVATGVGTGTGTATAIGLLAAPDAQQPGAGLQWLDASGNRSHLTLPASGVRWSLPNASGHIVVEATVVHSGATNIQLGGAALIDVGRQWRIVAISANSTAVATVTLGNVSAGAQHVASVALAIGNNALAIVAGAGNFLSTANLWSGSSGVATIRYTLTLAPA